MCLMDMNPQTHFFFCNVTLYVRVNNVWNTAVMNKVFRISMDDGGSIVRTEGKFTSRKSLLYFLQDITGFNLMLILLMGGISPSSA